MARRTGMLAMLLIAVGVVALIPLMAGGAKTREITLVARDMTFYIDGDYATPNPTIRVRRGEQIRLVLRNEDPGIRHDVAIAAWGIASPSLDGEGATSITWIAPRTRARERYTCRPHAQMMAGLIEVQ